MRRHRPPKSKTSTYVQPARTVANKNNFCYDYYDGDEPKVKIISPILASKKQWRVKTLTKLAKENTSEEVAMCHFIVSNGLAHGCQLVLENNPHTLSILRVIMDIYSNELCYIIRTIKDHPIAKKYFQKEYKDNTSFLNRFTEPEDGIAVWAFWINNRVVLSEPFWRVMTLDDYNAIGHYSTIQRYCYSYYGIYYAASYDVVKRHIRDHDFFPRSEKAALLKGLLFRRRYNIIKLLIDKDFVDDITDINKELQDCIKRKELDIIKNNKECLTNDLLSYAIDCYREDSSPETKPERFNLIREIITLLGDNFHDECLRNAIPRGTVELVQLLLTSNVPPYTNIVDDVILYERYDLVALILKYTVLTKKDYNKLADFGEW